MSFARRTRRSTADEENTYWMSFTDIMSGLLILFILAAVALMLQLVTKQDELGIALAEVDRQMAEQEQQQAAFDEQIGMISDAENVRTDVLHDVQDRLHAAGIEVVLNEDSSVLSIPSAALGFDSGAYEIDEAYHDRATAIGATLSEVLRQGDRIQHLDTVFIEGHTDAVPYTGVRDMDNWGLSTFRAIALWQLWSEELREAERLDALVNADGHPLFSVSGYAATRLAEGAPSDASPHAPSRRIDIRITIVRPSSDELQQISDEFAEGASA